MPQDTGQRGHAALPQVTTKDLGPKPSHELASWSGLRRPVSFSADSMLLFLADTHNIYTLDLRGEVQTVAHIEDPNGRVLGCDWLDAGSSALPATTAIP